MRHIPEGTLRRLVDEPLAVADADAAHVARCARCRDHREAIARDAASAARRASGPRPAPDVDAGWRRLQVAAAAGATVGAHGGVAEGEQAVRGAAAAASPGLVGRRAHVHRRWTWRLATFPVPSAAVIALIGVLVGGGAAATAMTTVFAPSTVAPLTISTADFQAVADTFGFEGSGDVGSGVIGGFHTPSGSLHLAFGTLSWKSNGRPIRVASIAAAEAMTGMTVTVLSTLPEGVGPPRAIGVQPEVTATITFDSAAGPKLAGTTLTVTGGPAVLIEYRSVGTVLGDFPALATVAMERPTATSSSETASELTAFLLSQPGVPAGLAQEIRMLGDGGQILPLPTASGAGVSQVDVDGSPGVLVSEGAGAASGVVWEDRTGVVHAALGLLDQEDILNVANELG